MYNNAAKTLAQVVEDVCFHEIDARGGGVLGDHVPFRLSHSLGMSLLFKIHNNMLLWTFIKLLSEEGHTPGGGGMERQGGSRFWVGNATCERNVENATKMGIFSSSENASKVLKKFRMLKRNRRCHEDTLPRMSLTAPYCISCPQQCHRHQWHKFTVQNRRDLQISHIQPMEWYGLLCPSPLSVHAWVVGGKQQRPGHWGLGIHPPNQPPTRGGGGSGEVNFGLRTFFDTSQKVEENCPSGSTQPDS